MKLREMIRQEAYLATGRPVTALSIDEVEIADDGMLMRASVHFEIEPHRFNLEIVKVLDARQDGAAGP